MNRVYSKKLREINWWDNLHDICCSKVAPRVITIFIIPLNCHSFICAQIAKEWRCTLAATLWTKHWTLASKEHLEDWLQLNWSELSGILQIQMQIQIQIQIQIQMQIQIQWLRRRQQNHRLHNKFKFEVLQLCRVIEPDVS